MFLMRPFVTLFALGFIGWLGYIMISSDPKVRLERSCVPVGWFGKAAVSASDLLTDSMSAGVQDFVNNREIDCRYIVWRQFFEEDYLKQQKQLQDLRKQFNEIKSTASQVESPK